MDREGGNRQIMRKSWEWISLHFLILSPFPRSPAARLQRVAQPCFFLVSLASVAFLSLYSLEKLERQWGNGKRFTLYTSSFSLYFLPLYPFSIWKLSHFVAKCWIRHFCRECHKKLTYVLWDNNSGSNSLHKLWGLLTADFPKKSCLWAIGGQFHFISKGSFFNIHNRMLKKAERNLWKCLWQMNKCQSVSWKRQIKSACGIFWPWLILAPACRLAGKFIIIST